MRLALVTSVTCAAAAGQVPDQPACPSCRTAPRRPRRARAGPATWSSSQRSFGPGEVGRERQPAARRGSGPGPTSPPSSRHRSVGAGVLPDDRVVHRARRCARSHSTVVSRWLVMPIATRSRGAQAAPCRAPPATTACDVVPDLGRVVLDPARAREDLAVLAAGRRRRSGRARSKTMQRRRGGALVDRGDVALALTSTSAALTTGSRRGRARPPGPPRARRRPGRCAAPSLSAQPLDRARDADRADRRRRGGPGSARPATTSPVHELLHVGRPAALAHLVELARASASGVGRPCVGVKRGQPGAIELVGRVRVAGEQHLAQRGRVSRAAARRPRAPGGCRPAGRRGGRRAPGPRAACRCARSRRCARPASPPS